MKGVRRRVGEKDAQFHAPTECRPNRFHEGEWPRAGVVGEVPLLV